MTEYTAGQIAKILQTDEDMVRVLAKRHRLKQVAYGHKIYCKHRDGQMTQDYVFYGYVLPIFRELLEACKMYSEIEEKKRMKISRRALGESDTDRRGSLMQ